MKIGICDDCRKEREQVKAYCEQLGYHDIFLYESGKALLESKDIPLLNVLFLDIEMNHTSGIDVKNTLEVIGPATFIVFYTSHTEFMPDAFGKNVISFLQKPVTNHEIERCLKKAAYLGREYYPIIIDTQNSPCCKDVLYLYTKQKYTIFYLLSGATVSNRKTLNEWEDQLSPLGFCRIHRSYLVNLKHVTILAKNTAKLTNGRELPVSRRHSGHLTNAYNNYVLSKMTYSTPNL